MYHAIQTTLDRATPEEIAAMDLEIAALREELASSRAEEKTQRAALTSLSGIQSIEDLRSGVQALEAERKELLARLACHREGKVQPIPTEEKEAAEEELKRWAIQAVVRKKIAKELFLTVHDVVQGKSKEELWVSITAGER